MLDQWYQNHPLVFAHRGARADAPMNTLPAFELAVKQHADGIELDVQRSKDGHAVIMHDYTVDSTTDGSGRVSEMTLAELKALDAGSWYGEQFRGVRIPTLDEVFETVGQQLYVNVEIKSESADTDGVEQVAADVIRAHQMQGRVIVSSFNPLALQRFRAIVPEVAIGFLHAPNMPTDTQALLQQLNLLHEARHPHESQVDEAYMSWARAQGYRVHTWTVNDPARALELRDLGVDGIITDQPDVILQAVRGG
jgi:glycerophosphoryl diester phosphodiesterase